MKEILHRYWQQAWTLLTLQPSPKCFDELVQAYQQPHRHYHTQQHLVECLTLWQERCQQEEAALVAIALFFHDSVYVPTAKDNEEQSAHWACTALMAAGASLAQQQRVRQLIMATAGHQSSSDATVNWLIAIDLAILGAKTQRYQQYSQQIRAEYQHLSDAVYQQGRAQVLQYFLQADPLFPDRELQARYQQRALVNLQQEYEYLINF